MNILNMIPVVGWAIAFIITALVAIPVSLLWNWLIPIYIPMLPGYIPWSHMTGLIWLTLSLKGIILPGRMVAMPLSRATK